MPDDVPAQTPSEAETMAAKFGRGASRRRRRVLREQGRYAEAEAPWREALVLDRRFTGESAYVAADLEDLADTLTRLDRSGEAIEPFEEAVELRRKVHGADDSRAAWTLSMLGGARLRAGLISEAESSLIEVWEALQSDDAATQSNLGMNTAWRLMHLSAAKSDDASAQTWRARLSEEFLQRVAEDPSNW